LNFFPVQSVQVKNSKYRKAAILFLFSLLLLTVVVYILQPPFANVSMALFYFIVVLAGLANFIYFKTKKKVNYLDFDTIFIFIFCLVGFSTTFFYEDRLLYRALFLGFPVSDLFVNRGNLLFLIGLFGYLIGSLSVPDYLIISKYYNRMIINSFVPSVILLFSIVLFVLSGGISFYMDVYTGGEAVPGISLHILLVIICTGTVLIATELYNKRNLFSYKIKKISIVSIFLFALVLMLIGNRTASSQLFLAFLGVYTMFFLNLDFKKFCIFLLLAIFSMWIIQNTRANYEIDISAPILVISDLTIPSRQTYAAIEYVYRNGLTYGRTMSLGIIGLVPFLPSILLGDNVRYFSTGMLLTERTFEQMNMQVEIGLGSTIIADIYLSFGLLGVIFLMFLLGYFVNKLYVNSMNNEYYSLIVLSVMLSNSVFIVRDSYLFPLRFIVWSVIIASINIFFISTLKINQKVTRYFL